MEPFSLPLSCVRRGWERMLLSQVHEHYNCHLEWIQASRKEKYKQKVTALPPRSRVPTSSEPLVLGLRGLHSLLGFPSSSQIQVWHKYGANFALKRTLSMMMDRKSVWSGGGQSWHLPWGAYTRRSPLLKSPHSAHSFHCFFRQPVTGNPFFQTCGRTQTHWTTEWYPEITCSATPVPFVPTQPGRGPLVQRQTGYGWKRNWWSKNKQPKKQSRKMLGSRWGEGLHFYFLYLPQKNPFNKACGRA